MLKLLLLFSYIAALLVSSDDHCSCFLIIATLYWAAVITTASVLSFLQLIVLEVSRKLHYSRIIPNLPHQYIPFNAMLKITAALFSLLKLIIGQ